MKATHEDAQGVAPLLEVQDLTVQYESRARRFTAVEGVSFSIAPNETVGLVGESGSGKSTIARAILGLAPVAEGEIRLGGKDITHWRMKQRRVLTSEVQVVFQDPYSSLNPSRTVGQTLAESLRREQPRPSDAETQQRIKQVLEEVGLPADTSARFPGHFSGGQRQRIAIARALISKARLVICDEPVSALDLSVQAQILKLLKQLQDDHGLSYLFISHDLGVVRLVADRVLVLYGGMIMEEGDAPELYRSPKHPYTRSLLSAAPIPDPAVQRERRRAKSSMKKVSTEHVSRPAEGCRFATRCAAAQEKCTTTRPLLEPTSVKAEVACHFWREIADHLDRRDQLVTAPDVAAEVSQSVPQPLRHQA